MATHNATLADDVAETLRRIRGQGHTRFLGAVARELLLPGEPPIRVAFFTREEAFRFAQEHRLNPATCLSIQDPDRFVGVRGPVLVDLHVLQELADESIRRRTAAETKLRLAEERATARLREMRAVLARTERYASNTAGDLRATLVKTRAKLRKTTEALRRARKK